MDVKMQSNEAVGDRGKSFAPPVTAKGGPAPGKSKTIIVVVVAVLLLAAVGFGFKSWSDNNDKSKALAESSRAVLTVDLTPVKKMDFERKLLVSGTVSAWDPVQVGSEVGGLRVESIAVDEGAHVRKGQIMATLNNSILKAQLAQQEARLAASKASLTKAIQPNRPEDLTSLQAAYDQAQVSVAQEEANLMKVQATAQEAEANAKRYEFLVKQGVVSGMEGLSRSTTAKTSAADVHSAEARVKAARFAAQQAHERLSMGLSGGRNEDVVISRASLSEIEATVRQLRAQVDQTIIRAPCDGLVVKRDVHIGDIAGATKGMFELVRDGRYELRAQVPEADLFRIKPGQRVEVQSALATAPVTAGTVREISQTVDPDSRLGTVKIDLPADVRAGFRSGNFAKGEIFLGKDNVMAVPAGCVVYKDNRAIVFTVSADNNVQMRFIETGERDLDNIEVRSGLSGSEALVAKGAGFLKDGDKVRVAPRP
jgi:HlyD family secretion protein